MFPVTYVCMCPPTCSSVEVSIWLKHLPVTTRQWSCGKVMFSQTSVILFGGWGWGTYPHGTIPPTRTIPEITNYKNRRYASCWNAILLIIILVNRVPKQQQQQQRLSSNESRGGFHEITLINLHCKRTSPGLYSSRALHRNCLPSFVYQCTAFNFIV